MTDFAFGRGSAPAVGTPRANGATAAAVRNARREWAPWSAARKLPTSNMASPGEAWRNADGVTVPDREQREQEPGRVRSPCRTPQGERVAPSATPTPIAGGNGLRRL